ncbi:MAG: hypothetical protein HQK54_08650 [Oligoflexales bacterium]|nr:hypothetical protein [Oligoflexales bacterium]
MARWSKLKKKIENLFVPALNLEMHCNVYKFTTKHDTYYSPRTWLECDGKVLFDFPGMFLYWKNPEEFGSLKYMEDGTSNLGGLMNEYLETPRAELLDKKFISDRWDFTVFLKIADRRIGRAKLKAAFGHYPLRHPAGALLHKRLTGEVIKEICEKKYRSFDIEGVMTGLPDSIRVKTRSICDGYSDPQDIPAVRVLKKRRDGNIFLLFSIKIADQPQVLEEHIEWWEHESYSKEKLRKIILWISQNKRVSWISGKMDCHGPMERL